MNPLVYHIVSGQSFFSGATCILLAIWLSSRTSARVRRYRGTVFFVGAILVLLSSTPLPVPLYLAILFGTVAWFSTRWIEHDRGTISFVLAGCWIVAVAWELSHCVVPTIEPRISADPILIVADSVTAGLGDDPSEQTWPGILHRESGIAVNDQSHVGETAASALKRVAGRHHTETVVVEIGGNDLLGSTSPERFERDLDALVAELHDRKATRQIIMFELPLPPFAHRYGYAQRRVAARYNVKMIPKRVLLSVLAGEQSTLDSIHLSQSGHRKMAAVMLSLLQD